MKTALPVGLIRGVMYRSVTPLLLALLFVVSSGVSVADTQAQREKKAKREAKKHEVKPHAAAKHTVEKHPNEHPETHAKEHEAAAKKRRSEDKKLKSKAESKSKAANKEEAHPIALRRRADTASGRKKGSSAGKDSARASRVHAYEEAKAKQSGAGKVASDRSGLSGRSDLGDAHPAGSPDAGKAGVAGAEPTAASAAATTTGVSNPPPDTPQAEVSKQTDVVSVIRRSGDRPQLEPTEELAAEPVILPALYTKRGRLVMPPPLKGSHEILIRQNQMADDEGLDRIRDDEDLERMRVAGLLVPVPASAKLHVDDRLPSNRRYCRPWAALFLADMAGQFYARFSEALQVNSAVRTVEFQQRLIHTNGNAAPAEGDSASPHLTGQAVDIGKHGLSLAEIAWMRAYLLPLVQAGKVDVEEEFQQSCFHISVYKSYLPRAAGRREVATVHHGGMSALATGLR